MPPAVASAIKVSVAALFLLAYACEQAQIDFCHHVPQSFLNALIAATTLEWTSLSKGTDRA